MISENVTFACDIAGDIFSWENVVLIILFPIIAGIFLYEYKKYTDENNKKQSLKDEYKSNIVSILLQVAQNVEQYLHVEPSDYLDLQSELSENFYRQLIDIISKPPEKIDPLIDEQFKEIIRSLKKIRTFHVKTGNDIPEFNQKCKDIQHECSELIHAINTKLYL